MLIRCKECGHEISHSAVSCPNCGFLVSYSLDGLEAKYIDACHSILSKVQAEFQMRPDEALAVVESGLKESERRIPVTFDVKQSRVCIEEINRVANGLYDILRSDFCKIKHIKNRFVSALYGISGLAFDMLLKRRIESDLAQIKPIKTSYEEREENIAKREDEAIRQYKLLYVTHKHDCWLCKCRLTEKHSTWPMQLTGREGRIVSIRFGVPLCPACAINHKREIEKARSAYDCALREYEKTVRLMRFIVLFRKKVLANAYTPVKVSSAEIIRLTKTVFENFPLVKVLRDKSYQWGNNYDTGIRGRGMGKCDPDILIDL